MADTFKKLVAGVNPLITTETEWFSVPASHQYQGYVRITNIGTSDSTYRLAGVAETSTAVVDADYEAYDTEIGSGDIHDLTMDLGPLETLVVYADSGDVVFNFRGLDIDVS